MSAYGVVLFFTTSSAMRGEKVTRAAGLDVKLVPTPRELSSDCGISLRFARADAEEVRRCLDDKGVEYDDVYEI
ncbi:MAG: DUF3343 domain-containing protein [Candidatus Zixiibacteriota bacterium]|jgi:hypothetical protein